jgi:XisH protein
MPAKDIYHNCVKNALIKDNWTITNDPLSLKWGTKDMYSGREKDSRTLLGRDPSWFKWLYKLSVIPHLFEKGYMWI